MQDGLNCCITRMCAVVFCALLAQAGPGLCDENARVSLETTTITASKRETVADEFPGSISITDAGFIEDHQVRSTDDVARFVPNLFYKQASSGDAFVSRGISTLDTSLFSPMGLYVDDVAFPLSYMQMQPLFDAERVEVLRGPQSTLYGKNSSSGVINVILAEPDNEARARVFAEAGNYNTRFAGGAASGPIIPDQLFYRVAVSGFATDGFVENQITGADDLDDDTTLSASGALKWTPTPELEVSLALDGTDRDLGLGALRFESGPYATDRFRAYTNMDDRAEQDSLGQSLKVRYEFGGADLVSISAHRRFDRTAAMDFDRTPVDLGNSNIDLDQESWTQELRLSSDASPSLSWLLGLYAAREELDNTWTLNHVNPMIANTRVSDTEFENIALFGQSTLGLTSRLDVTAGLRLDHATASGTQVYTPNTGAIVYSEDLSDTEVLPMASLSWAFTDRIRGYATVSTGWLAGGYDYYTARSKQTFAYDAEYTRNYEAGLKASFFGNRLRASLSGFYTDIDDKQVKEEVPGGGIGAWKITNAAEAHTTGVELEVRAMPLAGLEIFGGLGYARTEIDDWTGTSGGTLIDYSGNALPWAPELTANAGVGYYSGAGWYGAADLFVAGKQYFDAANTLSDNGYALVNLKAGYRFGRFDISLWCKNLFDEHYANKKVASMGNVMIDDGAPMTLGMTFNWRL